MCVAEVIVFALEQAAGQGVMLARQRAGTSCVFPFADQQRGVVCVPGSGELGRVNMMQGAVSCEGDVCEALHLPLGVGGLVRPAPLAGRGGIDDGLELAERVGVAQRVPGQGRVGVVGSPRVMDRDAAEAGGALRRRPYPPVPAGGAR